MSPTAFLLYESHGPPRLHLIFGIQCITLAPVVAIQTELATPEDKEALARGLTASGKSSTGSIDGDIIAFSSEITK